MKLSEEKKDDSEVKGDADTGTLLKTAIDSMTSLHKRMDAMEAKADADKAEAEEKKKADAEETIRYFGKESNKHRADEGKDEKEEAEDKPEKVAADKKKADAKNKADAEEEAKCKADAEAEEEERKKSDAERVRKDSELTSRLEQLEARTPRDVSDEDRAAYSTAQARADSVYQAFGKRAPSPLLGENLSAYRKRLVSSLKTYSDDWKDVDLNVIADDALFSKVERNVYADAMSAANNPHFVPEGTLMPIERQSGGHTFIEYKGEPRAWMDNLSGPVRQHVTSILTPNASAR